jgi:hypothetical protein
MREPIYFDFSEQLPRARLNLLSEQKQWEYLNSNVKRKPGTRFLKAYASYVVSLELTLSRSRRNRNLSKFMLGLKTFDTNNTQVAVSSRPVIIAYQSTVSKVLEGLVFFPFRLFGIFKNSETSVVRLDMMSNYVEPLTPTETLEFWLSTNEADVEGVSLSVFPHFNYVTYGMFYYPWLAFIAGVCIIAFFELNISLLGIGIYYGIKLLTAEPGLEGSERPASSDAGTDDDSGSEVLLSLVHI